MSKSKKQPSKEKIIEIIERTDKLFEKWCSGVVKGKSPDEMYIVWQGTLKDKRVIQAKLFQGLVGFMIGMQGGAMLFTERVVEQHEQMLKDFEQALVQILTLEDRPAGDA